MFARSQYNCSQEESWIYRGIIRPFEVTGEASAAAEFPAGDVTIKLVTPGDYGLMCFVADAKDGKPHLVHGMVKTIKVS